MTFNPQPKPIPAPKKKREPIRQVSKKRSRQMNQYSKKKAEFLRENEWCQVCGMRKADQIHHMDGRENERLLDDTKWLAVDGVCHRYITDNPEWSKANGYEI